MINFDDTVKENIKKHDPIQPGIPDQSYRVLTIRGSGSGKIPSLFNLINQQSDIDKIYLHAKDPYEAKYKSSINKRESIGLKDFHDSKGFIEYSNKMVDIYKKDLNIIIQIKNEKH